MKDVFGFQSRIEVILVVSSGLFLVLFVAFALVEYISEISSSFGELILVYPINHPFSFKKGKMQV